MFVALVEDQKTTIGISGNIIDVMMSVTMIIDAIATCDDLSEIDRDMFKKFVKTELPRLAFASDEEVDKETDRLKNEKNEILRKIFEDAVKAFENALGDLK